VSCLLTLACCRCRDARRQTTAGQCADVPLGFGPCRLPPVSTPGPSPLTVDSSSRAIPGPDLTEFEMQQTLPIPLTSYFQKQRAKRREEEVEGDPGWQMADPRWLCWDAKVSRWNGSGRPDPQKRVDPHLWTCCPFIFVLLRPPEAHSGLEPKGTWIRVKFVKMKIIYVLM